MMFTGVGLAVSASTLLTINGDYAGRQWQVYLFKPLGVMLLLASMWWQLNEFTLWHGLIFAGLGLSLAGDIFLMWPKDRFIPGLVSFLLAHLCYIGAFYQYYSGAVSWPWVTGLLFFGWGYYRLLAPGLGQLRLPVQIYLGVILMMVWLAGELFFGKTSHSGPEQEAFIGLFAGALIFAFSDATLAWNKFRQSFYLAQLMILASYFLAQWLIWRSALLV